MACSITRPGSASLWDVSVVALLRCLPVLCHVTSKCQSLKGPQRSEALPCGQSGAESSLGFVASLWLPIQVSHQCCARCTGQPWSVCRLLVGEADANQPVTQLRVRVQPTPALGRWGYLPRETWPGHLVG